MNDIISDNCIWPCMICGPGYGERLIIPSSNWTHRNNRPTPVFLCWTCALDICRFMEGNTYCKNGVCNSGQ